MIEETYQETRDRMGKTITALKNELKRIRTGRASAALLDGIQLDYYGALTPLNEKEESLVAQMAAQTRPIFPMG